MNALQTIFCNSAEEYQKAFGSRMPMRHAKTMIDIRLCRTESMGTNLYRCCDCKRHHLTNRSCGNRHCPTCQAEKGYAWYEKNRAAMLPCSHFMITFTMPAQMHEAARANQRIVYDAFFKAAYASVAKLAADTKFLGARCGALAVLHTWGDQMQWHPHIHMLIPAGGVLNENEWRNSRLDFFVPVRALSTIVRAKMRDALKGESFFSLIPSRVWHEGWNVHSKNVGNGHRALAYLASYLFRVAISPKRIVRADTETVTFRRKKERSNKLGNLTIPTKEFLRRFLQHTLPTGFMKVRRYGILAINGGVDLQALTTTILGGFNAISAPDQPTAAKTRFRCKQCGATMKLVRIFAPVCKGVVAASG